MKELLICVDDAYSLETKECMMNNFVPYVPEIIKLIGEYGTNIVKIETATCFKYGYYKNKKFILHREYDEPAIEYKNGDTEWWKDGVLHRVGAPACEYTTHCEYWNRGVVHKFTY